MSSSKLKHTFTFLTVLQVLNLAITKTIAKLLVRGKKVTKIGTLKKYSIYNYNLERQRGKENYDIAKEN